MTKSLSQLCWEWIEKQPDFSIAELAAANGITRKKARSVKDHLVKKGAITQTKHANVFHQIYTAVPGAKPSFTRHRENPHGEKNQRQRIWHCLRWRQPAPFTIADVQEATACSYVNIRYYLNCLKRYGYVVVVKKPKSGKPGIYRLVAKSGRQYPRITKRGLYDPNTGKIIPDPTKQQESKSELAGTA